MSRFVREVPPHYWYKPSTAKFHHLFPVALHRVRKWGNLVRWSLCRAWEAKNVDVESVGVHMYEDLPAPPDVEVRGYKCEACASGLDKLERKAEGR